MIKLKMKINPFPPLVVQSTAMLSQLCLYFLRLGAIGFGGPVALVGYMYRDLVEEKKWFSESEYKEALALCQMAPGPLAAQMAIYLGWLRGKTLGATLTGICFVLPSYLLVILLSLLYVQYGNLGWIQGAFYGVAAPVVAIVFFTGVKLAKKMIKSDPFLIGLAAAVGVLALTKWVEQPILFLGAGVISVLFRQGVRANNNKLMLSVLGLSLFPALEVSKLTRIFLFFAKGGAFVFGSGMVILPFLHDGIVNDFKWLTEKQFIDAFAIAMVTPGPVLITVAFIGFLISGIWGSLAATLGIFLPCYLMVLGLAPSFQKISKIAGVKDFVDGVTSAAIGSIMAGSLLLAIQSLVDPWLIVMCACSFAVLLRSKRGHEIALIFTSAVLGFLIKRFLPV